MRIQALTGRHAGQDVFVLGTGPSVRCTDLSALRGRVVIGLNQAWRYAGPFDLAYGLTAHPELYQDYARAVPRSPTRWVVKVKPPMESLSLDDPDVYAYRTSTSLEAVVSRPADTLYLGEGIQATALDLAARMGARAVFLVGVDMTDLGGDKHAHHQHVRFLGQAPAEQYRLYRKHTAAVRGLLRTHFGVPVFTLSPFVGVGHAEEDYQRLRQELNLPPLPPPPDVSPYVRLPGGRVRTLRPGETPEQALRRGD